MNIYLNKYADIKRLYSLNNYKIVNFHNNSNICYIFVRSAYLTPSTISNDFINNFNDDYEWENISKSRLVYKKAKKIIFIRDTLSLFYSLGINSTINSIDKIISFLQEETVGMRVIIAGYSAGGYLAMILSSKLDNVDRALSFGGPVNLFVWDGSKHMYSKEDCDYFTYNTNKSQRSYFDLCKAELVFNNLFYFYGANNSVDKYQASFLKGRDDVCMLSMDSEKHCGNVDATALLFLLSCSNSKLKKIKKMEYKKRNTFNNDLILSPFIKAIYFLKKIKKTIKKLL